MHRSILAIATAISALSACVAVQDEAHVHESGDRASAVILSGDELAAELATSPVREAPAPFTRIGLMWEAEAAGSLEIAVSSDGDSWSEWLPADVFGAEVEDTAVFVGERPVASAELAGFYRLRAAGAAAPPTFVAMEFLEQTLDEALEDGEMMDADGPQPVAITIGSAEVMSRADWGARAPKCVSNHSPDRFTIHHTVTPNNDSQSPAARIRGIQSYHQNVRGWCDIGYQYLVSQDGRLWEGRGAARLGSHVGGGNTNNVGISFIGDYTNVRPTATQISATGALIAGVADRYGISLASNAKVKGHRDQGQTSCPGNALYARLGDIRAAARGGGTPPPPPPPPPVGTTVKGIVYAGNDTSQRIVGATITLGSRTTTSAENGYYEFENVEASSVSPSASASGFAPSGVTRATTGAVTWASISMTRASGTAILQGVVYRGSNSANRVANATVELSSGAVIQTDDNGYYRLDNLAPGAVTLTARSGSDSGSVSRMLENGSVTWGSVAL
jgi:hypothetical protein